MWVAESGIPGVLAATAHCYSLRCAGEPLLGALAWSDPDALGDAACRALADEALLRLHGTVAGIADRALGSAAIRRQQRADREAAAAEGADPDQAPRPPPRPPRRRCRRAPTGGSRPCGHRKGRVFIDETCAGGTGRCNRRGSVRSGTMAAGTFGATERNPHWSLLSGASVGYLDALGAWLRTLGTGEALPDDGARAARPPRGGRAPGSHFLEDGAVGGPAARMRGLLPDLETWRGALRLPDLARPLAIPPDFDPVAQRWIDIDEPAGAGARRFCSPAPILARLDGGRKTIFVRAETGCGKTETCVGSREGSAGAGPRGILQAVLDDPALMGLPSVPGAPPRVLYVTVGRVQPDILVKDPRFAALTYPSASGERVPVAWTVYKEARSEELAEAAFVMCTVQSGRRLEGDFDVVIVDEGARALTTLTTGGPFKGPEHHAQTVAWFDRALEALALVIVADADLLDEDAALYAARRPGTDVVSYLKRGSNDARLRWTAIDIRYAAAVIAAKLLDGEVGYIAASTRRAHWELKSNVNRHLRLRGQRCEFVYADADKRARDTMTDPDYVSSTLCYAVNYAMPQGSDFSRGRPATFVAYIEEGRTADINAGFQLVRRRRHVVGPDALYFCHFPKSAPLLDRVGRPLHAPVDWQAIHRDLTDSLRAWNERLPEEKRVALKDHYLRVRAIRTAIRNATHACPMLAFHLKLQSLGNEGLYILPLPQPPEGSKKGSARGRNRRAPAAQAQAPAPAAPSGAPSAGGLPWMPEAYSKEAGVLAAEVEARERLLPIVAAPRLSDYACAKAICSSMEHGTSKLELSDAARRAWKRARAAARFGLHPEHVGHAEVRLSEQSPPVEIFRLSKRFALDTLEYLATGAGPEEEPATLLPDHSERRRPFESALRLFELLGVRIPPGGVGGGGAALAAGLRYLLWTTWEGPEAWGAARLRGLAEGLENGGAFTEGALGRLFADVCRTAWDRFAAPLSEERPPALEDCARRLLHDLVVHAAAQLGLGVLIAATEARRVVRGGQRTTVKRTRYCFDPETVLLGLRLYGRDRDGRAGMPPNAALAALLAAAVRSHQILLARDPASKLVTSSECGGGGGGARSGPGAAPAEEEEASPRPGAGAWRVGRHLRAGVHSEVFFSEAARAVFGADAARCWREPEEEDQVGSPYAELLARAAASEATEALVPIAPPSPAAARTRRPPRLGFPPAEELPALPIEDVTWTLGRLASAAGPPGERAVALCPIVEGRGGPDPCIGFAYTAIFAQKELLPSSRIDLVRSGTGGSGVSLFVEDAARRLPAELARPRLERASRSAGRKMLLFVPTSTFAFFGVPLPGLPPPAPLA
eukprot:tig00000540_g1925.t1